MSVFNVDRLLKKPEEVVLLLVWVVRVTWLTTFVEQILFSIIVNYVFLGGFFMYLLSNFMESLSFFPFRCCCVVVVVVLFFAAVNVFSFSHTFPRLLPLFNSTITIIWNIGTLGTRCFFPLISWLSFILRKSVYFRSALGKWDSLRSTNIFQTKYLGNHLFPGHFLQVYFDFYCWPHKIADITSKLIKKSWAIFRSEEFGKSRFQEIVVENHLALLILVRRRPVKWPLMTYQKPSRECQTIDWAVEVNGKEFYWKELMKASLDSIQVLQADPVEIRVIRKGLSVTFNNDTITLPLESNGLLYF